MSSVTTSTPRSDSLGMITAVNSLRCQECSPRSTGCITPRQSTQRAISPVNTHKLAVLPQVCTHTNNGVKYQLIHTGGSLLGSGTVSPQIIDLCPSANAGSLLIGRCSSKAAVVLSGGCGAKYVSRVHAELSVDPSGAWVLVDKESENGCFVNGYRIRRQVLRHGDIITIGGGGASAFGVLEPNLDSEFVYRVVRSPILKPLPDNSAERPGVRAAVPEKRRRSSCISATERKALALVDLNSQPPLHKRRREDAKLVASSLATQQSVCNRRDTCQSAQIASICKELQCPICLGYLVSTHTLACGHSFCVKCIRSALEVRRACPMCVAPVRTAPVPSLALDNCVRRTLQPHLCCASSNSSQEQQASTDMSESVRDWTERVRAQKTRRKREQQRLKHFRKVVQKAKEKDQRFLKVYRPWKSNERRFFRKGLALYRGVLRREYCHTIMLTKQVVDECPPTALCIIANNIGMDVKHNKDFKVGSLRDRIKMFIDFS